MLTVIKRNGKKETFNDKKIINAILAAASAAGEKIDYAFCETVAALQASCPDDEITIAQIQKFVESCLMKSDYEDTARRYIIYRHSRDNNRCRENKQIQTFNEIIEVADNDTNRENANINAATPAGMMMKFASEVTREHSLDYLMNPEHAKSHRSGKIHCHDLDYYLTGSTTCSMIDLSEILKNGFDTSDGPVREPKTIRTAAQLAAIVMQSNQNEQHGGQAFGNFDYAMATYVRKSFVLHFIDYFEFQYDKQFDLDIDELRIDNTALKTLYPKVYRKAYQATKIETYQAMEAFMHNMVTMHSRGGAQIVFSSINYGTDTSVEGRMVINSVLDVTDRGGGKQGTTFIFPIQVFKVKESVNFSETDWNSAIKDWDKAISGKMKFVAPNFDLWLKACKVSARRLFPNFVFLDTTFNKHDAWHADDPMRYLHEVCTMGCRTRVFDDIFGDRTSMSRGNISFTTINIVRTAIESKRKAERFYEKEICAHGYTSMRTQIETMAQTLFFSGLEEVLGIAAEQLYIRYKFQSKRKMKQFPFLLGQNLWKNSQHLSHNEPVESAIKHGTLSIGFIGLAEALFMLIGEHHGQTKRAQKLGLEIVSYMRNFTDTCIKKYNLNYSLLATPAEGLSGRFVSIDRQKFGTIKGVTDREYYTNSNH